jgi:serine/threonine protein kinase
MTDSASAGDGDATLPAGYRLHEFQIERVLGEGGFGIVYLAQDLQLRRTVALKEYMPASLAVRQPGNVIDVRSESRRETFDLGLRSFVNEAQLLASFDNGSLVKVYRFWEQNGTAYMVMPFYEGPTLKAWLKAQAQPPDEAWLKRLLGPLLDALDLIHASHCYHRDIAPDNILLLGEQQHPMLLDFGAARRVIGDATQALTVILKPGYAPVEQYAEEVSMKQGAWTDVYALCAVLHMAITGRAPEASVGRMMNDKLVPLAVSAQGRYSAAFLEAIDAGLAVRPEHRPQDIAALRARLMAEQPADAQTIVQPIDSELTVLVASAGSGGPAAHRPGAPTGAAATVSATTMRASPAPMESISPVPPAVSARAGKRALLLTGVAGLVLAGAAAWYTSGSIRTAPGNDARPPSLAPAVATPVLPTAPGNAPAAPVEPVRAPFTAVAGLEDIVSHRDPLISVNTLADKGRIVIGKDPMQFRVGSSEAGYLYVFFVGTGSEQLQLLLPNAIDQDNRITANSMVSLPRKSWKIVAAGPPGVNRLVVMVSRAPRDFTAAGLKSDESISGFDPEQARRVWAATPANKAVFAGEALCPSGAGCDGNYGATLMHIEEVAAK